MGADDAAAMVDRPGGDPPHRWTSGELKQEILRIYNAVNQSISGVGVHRQRVDLLGDRILVVAEHKRIPALTASTPLAATSPEPSTSRSSTRASGDWPLSSPRASVCTCAPC